MVPLRNRSKKSIQVWYSKTQTSTFFGGANLSKPYWQFLYYG